VNANQVFVWRRAFERGELVESAALATALLPVVVPVPDEVVEESGQPEPRSTSGSIHIEFPGRALISAERGADPALLRSILEILRK
jgi:transposase-like protein